MAQPFSPYMNPSASAPRDLRQHVRAVLALLRAKRLCTEDIVAVVESARAGRRRLGRLAIDAGLITLKDVVDVLDAQQTRRIPFGEIAVEKGLLRRADVDALVALQAAEWMDLPIALVDRGLLTREELERAALGQRISPTAAAGLLGDEDV